MYTWHGERARLEPRPDPLDGALTISLIPITSGSPLSTSFLRQCTDEARRRGATKVLTPALTPVEADAFRRVGFRDRSSLILLVRDMASAGPIPAPRDSATVGTIRRARTHEHPAVLSVDRAAFGVDWCLDSFGLTEAIEATTSTRFRVAVDGSAAIVGYCVSGRARRRGYLQRLAVDPATQSRGIGAALVADCLSWCRRVRVARVVVNTQVGNDTAYHLYRRMGFVKADIGLAVLSLSIDAGASAPSSARSSS